MEKKLTKTNEVEYDLKLDIFERRRRKNWATFYFDK